MATFYQATKVKDNIVDQVLKKNGVTAIGVGYANPSNPKQGAAVLIYTQKSISANALALPPVLTANIQGKSFSAPIRILSSGNFKPNINATQPIYRRRLRPVPGGVSVGRNGGTGTAGLIVSNFPARNQLYLCSNNHVLNPTNGMTFASTIQSGPADGGLTSRDRIGRLDRFVRLTRGINFLDAATAIPIRNKLLNPRYLTIGTLKGHLLRYSVGNVLYKVGRTSGAVSGMVESVNVSVVVDYSSVYPQLGAIRFNNQTVIRGLSRPVSLPGDSGSVWITRFSRLAAACNFAGTGDGRRSIAFPIAWLMQVFRTRVATPSRASYRIIDPIKKGSHAYTRLLTPKELKSIKVVKARNN